MTRGQIKRYSGSGQGSVLPVGGLPSGSPNHIYVPDGLGLHTHECTSSVLPWDTSTGLLRPEVPVGPRETVVGGIRDEY